MTKGIVLIVDDDPGYREITADSPACLAELALLIARAVKLCALQRQNQTFQELQQRQHIRLATDVIGHSASMREIFGQAESLGAVDLPVLIEGETGAGRGVVAELIHAHSQRQKLPLTKVDCGASPENLLEAELFGHEKGTFTGATHARPGMFEIADMDVANSTEHADAGIELSPLHSVDCILGLDRGNLVEAAKYFYNNRGLPGSDGLTTSRRAAILTQRASS